MHIPRCSCCGKVTIRKFIDGSIEADEDREIWNDSHTGGLHSWGVAVFWTSWTGDESLGEDGVIHELGNFVIREALNPVERDGVYAGIIVAYRDDGGSQAIIWESDDELYADIRDEEYADVPGNEPVPPVNATRGAVNFPNYTLDGREYFYETESGYLGLIDGSVVQWEPDEDSGIMTMCAGWTADKTDPSGLSPEYLQISQISLQEDGSMHVVLWRGSGGFQTDPLYDDAAVLSAGFVLGDSYRDTYLNNASYKRAGHYSQADDLLEDSSRLEYVGLVDDGGFFVVSSWTAAYAYPAQTPYDWRINVVDENMDMLYEVDLFGNTENPFLSYITGTAYPFSVRWNFSVRGKSGTGFDGSITSNNQWHALGWYFETAATTGQYEIRETFASGDVTVTVNWDATAAQIKTALEAAWPGTINSVTGTGTFEDPFLVDHTESDANGVNALIVTNIATVFFEFNRCFCRGSDFWWQYEVTTYPFLAPPVYGGRAMHYADLSEGTPAVSSATFSDIVYQTNSGQVQFDGEKIEGNWDFARWVDGFLYVKVGGGLYQLSGRTANWKFPHAMSSCTSVRKFDGFLYVTGQWIENEDKFHVAKINESTGALVWQETHSAGGANALLADCLLNGDYLYAVGYAAE